MNQRGMTVIELLVVVSVISMLTATVVPAYRTYKAKARSAGAKIQLSSAFSAMKTFQAEFGTYHTCLSRMGFSNEGRPTYYAIGFRNDQIEESNSEISNCSTTIGNRQHFFPQTKEVQGVANVDPTTLPSLGVHGEGDCFALGAAGHIYDGDSSSLDRWNLDQDQKLHHITPGY